MSYKDRMVIGFLYKHTPNEFVRGDDAWVDWQGVLDNGPKLSSGEQAVVAFAAHLLDYPGIVNEFAQNRSLAGTISAMDSELQDEALAVLLNWAADKKLGV